MSGERKLRSTEKNRGTGTPYSSSPAATSSSVKLWNKIETRLETLTKNLTESIVSQLKTEINIMHNILSERITAIENDFNAKIKSVEQEFNDRCSSINHIVFSCKSAVESLGTHLCRIDALENELPTIKAQVIENDNAKLKLQIDALARKNIAGDLVLHGIPFAPDENLPEIFSKLCSTLNLTTIKPNHILRTTPVKNSSSGGAIIVKLPHPQIKTNILRRMKEYYKQNKKSVALSDLGFGSNKFVRVYESLTKNDHTLFRRANELRQNNCLHSVFTRSGRVFVKKSPEEKPICILNMMSLESLHTGGSNLPASIDTSVADAVSVAEDAID